MATVQITLLGAANIYRDAHCVTPKRRKALLLLAYLLLEPRLHARSHLAALLWPDAEPAQGLKLLRQVIYELKQGMGEQALRLTKQQLGINARCAMSSDVSQLLTYSRGDEHALKTPTTLADVERLCIPEFLEGFNLDACPLLEQWCYAVRESLRQCRCQWLAALVAAHRQRGEIDSALRLLAVWQQLDGLDEAVYRQQMELYAAQHHYAQALRVYQGCADMLRHELALAPSPGLRALYEQVRTEQSVATILPPPTSPSPLTQYLACSNVHMAYQVLGTGAHTLIVVGGFMSHLEQIWENSALAEFYRQLSQHVRVVLFDRRGMGMSDRLPQAPQLMEVVADIQCLITHLGVQRVALWGISEGGPIALRFAAQCPERVASVLIYGSAACWVKTEDYRPALSAQQFADWHAHLLAHWGTDDSIEFFAPSQRHVPEQRSWWAKTMRLSASPGELGRLLETIKHLDVRADLASIGCPVLILHKVADRVVHVAAARYLHAHIRAANLVLLPGSDHWFWTEQPDQVLQPLLTHLLALPPHLSDRAPDQASVPRPPTGRPPSKD